MEEFSTIRKNLLDSNEDTVNCEGGDMVRTWTAMGLEKREMEERLQLLCAYAAKVFKNIFKNSGAKELGILRSIEKDVASYNEQVQELRMELGHPIKDLCHGRGMTLLEQNNYLTEQLRVLVDEKVARMTEVTDLDERIEKLSEQLGQEARLQSLTQVPTADELEERTTYAYSLEKEKCERLETIEREQQQICRLFRQLERTPDGAYEQNLAMGAPLSLLPQPNLNAVEGFRQRLETEVGRNRERADQLRDRLVHLWKLLQMSTEEERGSFLASNGDHRPSDIKLLEDEVRLQESLKLDRLGIVITNIRAELLTMWGKCCYSEAQRAAFKEFHEDEYTEDLLQAHTEELERATSLYQNNQVLWNLVARRSQLWTKMLDLEFRADNPGRYNNRGGRLLQEEKERKKLLNQIPKLEQEILANVEASEASNGVRIMIFGEPATEHISHQWDQMREQKENQKLERQQAKVQLLKHEMQEGCKPNASTRRRFVGTPVRSPLLMMTRSNTPLTIGAKTGLGACSVAVTGRPPTSTKQSTSRKVTVLPRPRRLNLQKNSFKANPNSVLCNRTDNTSHLDASSLSTYSTFTANVNSKAVESESLPSASSPFGNSSQATQV